ncbi:Predicted thiol-disulfide oxidoreductase YuxK, DCC family [Marinobacter daqiaonensis]|uniref:Predicted thiol-disulfide oxidoreductase YuxK, DCC family n=1 Tax=Marinobacter daqiaonensis TaxID=650891 RepID=A0A1I6I656_9GAMM|nr:DCC1-like thiol-disulfide oxidoreductase family protein [Marinobacter daqiaonensis]SFR62236.1 Predicted thiol-disulfide oxidoreductase YuxK, DCC family [Marinobacter daqiaonensis]
MDILFHDGACSLCSKEIRILQKYEQGGLSFADIHRQPDSGAFAPGKEAMLRRLHLVAADGTWHVGIDATVRAWSHTPFGWLFRPLTWPLIRPLASRLYARWADRRYRRKYSCSQCSPPESAVEGGL